MRLLSGAVRVSVPDITEFVPVAAAHMVSLEVQQMAAASTLVMTMALTLVMTVASTLAMRQLSQLLTLAMMVASTLVMMVASTLETMVASTLVMMVALILATMVASTLETMVASTLETMVVLISAMVVALKLLLSPRFVVSSSRFSALSDRVLQGVECSSRRLSAKEANAAVLSSNKFRTDLLTDLLELQAFIEQRLSEMDNEEATSTVMHELQHAPDTVQHTDIDQLRTWQAQVVPLL